MNLLIFLFVFYFFLENFTRLQKETECDNKPCVQSLLPSSLTIISS
jgi:hypothetical protein